MRTKKRLVLIVSMAAGVAAAAQTALAAMPWCPWGCCAAKTAPGATLTQVSETRTKTPSVLAKMNSGTKRLVSNTKSIFSPKKPAAKKRTGTTATYSLHPKEEEPGFFRKLFTIEPPPPPKTVNEWMSLKQVHP